VPVLSCLVSILLFVDDFCLISSSPVQLITMIHVTRTWFENNRLTLSVKSKVMVFYETPSVRQTHDQTQWTIRRAFPPSADPLTITKVTQFVYIVVMVDPILSYNHHYTKILLSIQMLPNTSCLLVRPRQLCVVNQR
jgi:hypothetical protein